MAVSRTASKSIAKKAPARTAKKNDDRLPPVETSPLVFTPGVDFEEEMVTHFEGNLFADVELRFTQSGKAVATLPLVYNVRDQDDAGDWVDLGPMFYRVTVWGDAAEHCAESLQKGDGVVGYGRWETDQYENEEGESLDSVKCTARTVGASLAWRDVEIKRVQRTVYASKPAAKPAPAKKAPARRSPNRGE